VKLYTEAVLKLENWNKNDEFKLRRREDDMAEEVGPILWLVSLVCNSLQQRARVL
jgi:hypothetical protein